jgi:acyl-CoA reductase-like NAD-dependent aldehyde dehydrogenase
VAQQAGLHGKKVVLELGGSDPFIVLEDADIAKAVQLGVTSRYSNNAQSCIAAKRFFIAEPVADAFIKAFVEQASALKVGDPLLPDTKLGPQAREDLRATTERQVSDAKAAGARVLTGGKSLDGPGYFYPPTVLVDLPHDAPVAREEFFGPVALFFTFKTEEEAIRLANLARIVEEELIAVGIIDHQEPVAPRTLLDRNALGLEFRAQRVQRGDRGLARLPARRSGK